MVDRRAEFRIEEQQHALKHGTRHAQRFHGAGQRLAAGVAHHLRRDPRRQDQRLAELERKIFDVGGERRHLQRFDGARGACGGNARGRFQRRLREIVQDQRALAGVGGEKHAADFGRVLRLHRQARPCAAGLRSAAWPAAGQAALPGCRRASGTRWSGLDGRSPS